MGDANIFFGPEVEIMNVANTTISGQEVPEFVGFAAEGSGDDKPNWRIKKMTYSGNGSVVTIRWAFDLNEAADHGGAYKKVLVWDDRASYSYQ